MSTIVGTESDDTLNGTSSNDSILGLGGNDQIFPGNGEDFVDGGSGDDLINTILSTSANGSVLYRLYEITGLKRFEGGSGADVIFGGSDSDLIRGGEGSDRLNGWTGDDQLEGDSGDDILDGGAGNDTLHGGEGSDKIWGGDGDDILYAGSGDDTLEGGTGSDTLYDGEGSNQLEGDSSNDTYYVSNHRTTILDVHGDNDRAYVSADGAYIPDSIEHVIYLDGAIPVPYWISALLYEPDGIIKNTIQGQRTAHYTFPKTPPSYITNASGYDIVLSYIGFSDLQQARVRTAFQYIQSVLDLDFIETNSPHAADTFTFAFTRFIGPMANAAGFAYTPSSSHLGSDVYFRDEYMSSYLFSDGTSSASLLMHEIGHALGLKHPFESGPVLPDSEDSEFWTVMSYDQSPLSYYLEYRPLDLAVLHYLYGPNPSARSGDDIYVFNEHNYNFIWDGSGNDTVDASSSSRNVTINLSQGHWGFKGDEKASTITSAGQITINFGTVIEALIGSRFDDNLLGNEVANTLRGGSGNDSIHGDDGIDIAQFNGAYKDYSFVTQNETLQVSDSLPARDGIDTLSDIERLRFDDGRYAFDFDGNAGDVAKVLGAVFGKSAVLNPIFVGIGLHYLDQGMSAEELMEAALTERLGASPSHRTIVDLLFSNITGAPASDSDATPFVSLLTEKTLSVSQLGVMAAQTDLNGANIGLVGLAQTGLLYAEFSN